MLQEIFAAVGRAFRLYSRSEELADSLRQLSMQLSLDGDT